MMNTGNESVNKVGQIILAARNGTVGNHYQYSQAVTFKTKGTLDFAMNYSAKSDGARKGELLVERDGIFVHSRR